VKSYVANLLIKLHSDNRTQLAVRFVRGEHEDSAR